MSIIVGGKPIYCAMCHTLLMAQGTIEEAAKRYSRRNDAGEWVVCCPVCWSNPQNHGACEAFLAIAPIEPKLLDGSPHMYALSPDCGAECAHHRRGV